MTAKKLGIYADNGARYATVTDGNGTLVSMTTSSGSAQPSIGLEAPDNSTYFILTDGSGNLV